MDITHTITIERPPDAIYAFWRDPRNLAALTPGDIDVEPTSDRTSHWVARAPGGKRFEWDAEIIRDEPCTAIAWRSCPGADVENSGEVRFEPDGKSDATTQVRMAVHYTPPGGALGALLIKVAQKNAGRKVAAGLRQIKRQLESE